ncbi:MAG: hypothetical protein R3B74_09445 [Nitrospirales bacterium]|nr:hypothetical protein [Nitrospirales bacterium]
MDQEHQSFKDQQRLRSKVFYVLVSGFFVFLVGLGGLPSTGYTQSIGISWVKIKESKFEFDGWLTWGMSEGRMQPSVHGDLDLHDAEGLCGRMRMDLYGGAHLFLTTKYGGAKCADSGKRLRWEINLIPYDDNGNPYGSNKIDEVKVSIEKKTASQDWTIIGSKTVKMNTLHNKVKITEDGFDFGGESFVAGAPTKSGDVAWSWSGGEVTPRVTGRLHLNHVASACARLEIEYFSYDDVLLATKAGGKRCASDNSHYWGEIDLSPYSDGKIAYIKIHLQSLRADGTWRAVGSDSATYVNVPIACQGIKQPCGAVIVGD